MTVGSNRHSNSTRAMTCEHLRMLFASFVIVAITSHLAAADGDTTVPPSKVSIPDRDNDVQAFKVGDMVVSIRNTVIVVTNESAVWTERIPRGYSFQIEDIDGNQLWISDRRTGWIKDRDVARPNQAVLLFTELIGSNPHDERAYLARAEAQMCCDRFQEAIADINEALRLNPRDPNIPLRRSGCHKKMGDFSAAIADCDEVIRRMPGEAMGYVNRSDAWSRLEEYGKAEADADQALELATGISVAYVNRGWARTRLRKFDAAIEDFSAALKINPKEAYT